MKAAMKEISSTKNVLAGGDDSNKIEERSKGGGGHTNNNNNHKNQQTNKDGGGEPSVQEGSQQPSHSHEEFVNKGLQRWEEIRSQWISSGSQSSASSSVSSASSSTAARQPKQKKPKRYAKDIDIDEVIDLIVSNRWRQQAPQKQSVTGSSKSTSSLDTAKSATKRNDAACFAQPVSLPQMVDVLCDLWEAEGLDI